MGFFPVFIVGEFMNQILTCGPAAADLRLANPKTARQNSGVFLGIERSFPLTCENVSILRIKLEESNVSILPFMQSIAVARRNHASGHDLGRICHFITQRSPKREF